MRRLSLNCSIRFGIERKRNLFQHNKKVKRKLKQNLVLGLKLVSKLENMENGSKNKMLILKDQLMRIMPMMVIPMVPLENSTRTV